MEKQRIKEKCRNEICEINYILQGLYDERIYGYKGNECRNDASIQNNVSKLIGYLNKMLEKLEKDELEDSEEKLFKVIKGTSNG